MKKNILMISILMLLPAFVFAGTVVTALDDVYAILNVAKNVIFALAFIGFFWGLLTWIFASGEKKDDGKKIMLWGILALFIMFSVWGIIAILQNSIGGINQGTIDTPLLPDNL